MLNETENPRVTVITAVKNQKEKLKSTIKSITSNPYKNIDYIIIDGSSTDGTCDFLKENGHCIKYWISEHDNSIYDALNKGWKIADGDSFILFLGAGDELFQLPVQDMRSAGNKVLYGRVVIGKKKIFKPRVNWQTRFANTVHHQALLIPKRLHPSIPFDTRYKVYADFDFNQRLLKRGVEFKYSAEFLSYALPGGISTKYSNEAIKIAYRNYGYINSVLSLFFFLYQRGNSIHRFVK